jgi:predicted PurR-regulated permease PerM
LNVEPQRPVPEPDVPTVADDDVRDPGEFHGVEVEGSEPGGDRMQAAIDDAAALAQEDERFGRPGRPMNRQSPLFIGMAGAAGVAVTYVMVQLVLTARSVLVLIGLALFIAAGLDPIVTWLTRHRFPRPAAVTVVVLATLAVVGAFLAAAIPPLADEATILVGQLPSYAHSLQDHSSQLGKLNDKYHLQQRLSQLISGGSSSLVGGVLGAGQLVLSAASSLLIVVVLVIYFLAGMPGIKLLVYRLAPHSRRPRAILIGDEIFTKVGGFVLGTILTSLIAGATTFVWLEIMGVMDLIPAVGSTIGGIVVCLIALTVSLPTAIATAVFYVLYQLAENYLLDPRIIGRAVEIPPVVTVVAVLIGGALMGVIGALVAIPAAAAVRLILNEVVFPRLDRS